MSGELTRPCKRCRTAIVPRLIEIGDMSLVMAPIGAWYAAWNDEFCTPLCHHNNALDRVYRRDVWWLNNRSE